MIIKETKIVDTAEDNQGENNPERRTNEQKCASMHPPA